MYWIKLIDGAWWVGFMYHDGRFDKIASYGLGRGMAVAAAQRMNKG